MASKKSAFANMGASGRAGPSGSKRSQGSGDRIQQRMANSGTKGGHGVNKTAASQSAAHNNTKVLGARTALGGSPRPGKLP